MIIVIYSHASGETHRIPIYNYGDIERLADRYPIIETLEKHTKNPMELLQYLVQYLSSHQREAYLEDDGYRIKTKEQHRAETISKQLRRQALLQKSDKIQDQGIVTQVKPEMGELGASHTPDQPTPYGRRFVFAPAQEAGEKAVKQLDPSQLDKVTSAKIDNQHWYHAGKQGNHTFHFLSNTSNPYGKAIAGLITATHEGKNHLRAAFSESDKDESLDKLRQHLKSNDNDYDEPIALDSAKHMSEGWETHHPDLIHGIVPDKTLQAPPSTISSWISFAGVHGDKTPRVVTKESLKHFDRREKRREGGVQDKGISKRVSFFDDPKFSTAHREAAYSKLADDVFGLGEYVPKATVFKHPLSGRHWSAMEFVKGAKPVTKESRKDDLKEVTENGDIYKMALMNMIMGNNDRHLNNVLKDPAGKIRLIDHGLTFDYNDVTTGLTPQYIDDLHGDYSLLDEPVPESVHDWLWNIDSTKLASALHSMGAPHDITMNAVQRLGDARGWSNFMKHGRGDYPNMHRGLRHLADMIRARKFSIPLDKQNEISTQVRQRIIDNVKRPLAVVGNRNIPQTPQAPELTGDKTKTMPIGSQTVKNAATIAPDQARIMLNDAGKAAIKHPEDEVALRHDSASNGEKRQK